MRILHSALVLAAGMSSRMQGRNKLLLAVAGEPLIRRTVRAVLQARPQETVVVTGFDGGAVRAVLNGLPVRVQENPRFAEGQMTSVTAGLAALSLATDSVMVCLGDMALLTGADYLELLERFAALKDKSILVPQFRGQRGNPVLLAAWRLPEILLGRRNLGCRKLIADNPDDVHAYECADDRYVTDVDTPEDYARILLRLESGSAVTLEQSA